MEYKLTVEEQPEIEEKEELTVAEEDGLKTTLIGQLTELVKDEWDTVNKYKNAIASLGYTKENETVLDTECEQIISILEDIEEEEMVHIGQLQTALSLLTNTSPIEVGKQEGEEQIDEITERETVSDDELFDMDEPIEFEPLDDEDIIVDERLDKHTKRLYRELSDYDEV